MNKIILTLVTLLLFGLFSSAKAEVAISGYMEYMGGSADQSTALSQSNHGIDKGGFADGTYSRLNIDNNSTLDNGISVDVHFTLSNDCTAQDVVCNVSGPNSQDITFSGGFGTIAIGNTAPAGQRMHSRLTAANPGAEPDGGNLGNFYTGGTGTYGAANESGYAHNSAAITYMSNVYQGFSVGLNYAPNQTENYTGDGSDAQKNTWTTINNMSDKHEIVFKYATEVEGVGIAATYGFIGGNAGTQTAIQYNDHNEDTVTLNLSMGGFTADYRWHDKSDSGRVANDGSGGNESTSICAKYVTGAVSMAACRIEAGFDTSLTQNNEDDFSTISAGYNLGGGVNVAGVYFTREQTKDVTIETDVSGVMGIVSVGF